MAAPPAPLRVLSASPAACARGADGAGPVQPLPVSWALAGVNPAPAGAAAQLAAAYDPPAGTFSWNPGYPASQRPV